MFNYKRFSKHSLLDILYILKMCVYKYVHKYKYFCVDTLLQLQVLKFLPASTISSGQF